jgi:rhamnosyltransferase
MSKPQVSIIILTKNQKRFLKQSLPMIFTQTFKDFEVIIVDSGSIDGSLEIMENYPVKILKIKMVPFNYAKAFNFGASKAKGDYLVRLSGDAIPANQYWLENLLKGLESKKVVGTYSRYRFEKALNLSAVVIQSLLAEPVAWLKKRLGKNIPLMKNGAREKIGNGVK